MLVGSQASVLLARGDSHETFKLGELFPDSTTATDVWSGDSLDARSVIEVGSHDAVLILTK